MPSSTLSKVHTCTLDPDVTFLTKGKKPDPDAIAQQELLAKLDEIKPELDLFGTQLRNRVDLELRAVAQPG